MTALWTSAAAVAATGGQTPCDWQAHGVSIDTRTLQPGDLFVALKDVRDGHDFVAQALTKGAAAALVSRVPEGVAPDAPLLIVPDVLKGLEALGRAARARTAARVIGVTGSVGKTSTKEMLRAMLAGQGRVHAAEASYNNHWGVPLTLARMPADTDIAVIEIGMNHPGEIAPLARMADLDVAIITTVAPAHLFSFESIEGIAREKASILEGLRAGGTAILPLGLGVSGILTDTAARLGLRAVTFADSGADWTIASGQWGEEASAVQAATPKGARLFRVQSPGRHFAVNALAVLAAADALGLDPALSAQGLGRWVPPAGRGQRERIITDPVDDIGFDLIDDAFNANPASVAASLEVLSLLRPQDNVGRIQPGRRIAILGDMLELGETELALHAAIADHPALTSVAVVHCVGPRMKALHAALPMKKRGEWAETAAELLPRAGALVDAGDVVLVKGSKGIKVSLIVDALRKLGQASPQQDKGAE
ncbi:UDP-N-acetylmuramoyl-tripeptide--D-alanyl-D-alanine ligase [Gemmobacter lanyuensis]|uniref:UDP-N-acetylmuramoyl-tripeptide--D-alanyl-D-alanine ligase n=1 Tax=Gemmobacter lanyuensis TaxID=1054497 RepID=A0A918IYU9_9RHOB|nr:UDP-N-acetylmuramoyl-tripeptide--D-alanyl-D-alanine ligase [Gemmobacter lanyuensis]GGW37530.1 UDP-N-acetylmuramoyl-tripeptide--D-alanyl-D-alanine ligase [Gemmobacter lanyuensis]